MKAALAVTYTILNLLCWIAAILPARLLWDMDFAIFEPTTTPHTTFTRCLWTTIYTVKSTDWTREHVPKTEVRNQWLSEAEY